MNDLPTHPQATLQAIAEREPWRLGIGYDVNALDPTWNPNQRNVCRGPIRYEQGTQWWICESCGRISKSQFLEHKPVVHPAYFFFESLARFYAAKAGQHVDPVTASLQAMFLTGLALRYGALQLPGQTADFANQVIATAKA